MVHNPIKLHQFLISSFQNFMRTDRHCQIQYLLVAQGAGKYSTYKINKTPSNAQNLVVNDPVRHKRCKHENNLTNNFDLFNCTMMKAATMLHFGIIQATRNWLGRAAGTKIQHKAQPACVQYCQAHYRSKLNFSSFLQLLSKTFYHHVIFNNNGNQYLHTVMPASNTDNSNKKITLKYSWIHNISSFYFNAIFVKQFLIFYTSKSKHINIYST